MAKLVVAVSLAPSEFWGMTLQDTNTLIDEVNRYRRARAR